MLWNHLNIVTYQQTWRQNIRFRAVIEYSLNLVKVIMRRSLIIVWMCCSFWQAVLKVQWFGSLYLSIYFFAYNAKRIRISLQEGTSGYINAFIWFLWRQYRSLILTFSTCTGGGLCISWKWFEIYFICNSFEADTSVFYHCMTGDRGCKQIVTRGFLQVEVFY